MKRTLALTLVGLNLASPTFAQSTWDFSQPAATRAGRTSSAADVSAPADVAEKATVKGAWSFADSRPVQTGGADKGADASARKAPAPAPSTPAGHHDRPSMRGTQAPVAVMWSERPVAGRESARGGIVLDWSAEAASAIDHDAAASAAVEASTQVPAPRVSPAAEPAPTASPAKTPMSSSVPSKAPAQAAGPVEPRRPQPTGLERMSDEWPKAVKVGVQYRGRLEEQRGSALAAGRDDAYYLNRIRLETTVTALPWLKAFTQVQDAQTLGYDVAAQPTSLTNTFDLRQAYLDAHTRNANGLGLRAGRQELNFGEQRLIGASDWGNTARTFDALRASLTRPGVQVDAFVSSVVVVTQGAFDRRKHGETLSGTYVSFSHLLPRSVVEPYVFAKLQQHATGELGAPGDGATYTFGARSAGAVGPRFDYGVEVALQRGHVAADTIDALAGHYAGGWLLTRSRVKPRVVAEFNHASGDGNPRDGRRQTFDQLYPTNHSKYGIADQMEWRNMQDVMVGFAIDPTRKLKVNADVHRLFLATTGEGLFVGTTRRVLNRTATSRTVGDEIDIQTAYAFSKELSFAAGVGTLFAGDYLAQSTAAATLWTPYAMWNVKF